MTHPWKQFANVLDRHDAAGWLLMLLGAAIVAATVLAPPWLDLQRMQKQDRVLQRRAHRIQLQQQNYHAFIRAVERADPMIIQRLAWHHLNLKPAGTHTIRPNVPVERGPIPSVHRWVRPNLPPLPTTSEAAAIPETRLVRLLIGPPRPWVLAFGGWLVLIGLMVNPTPPEARRRNAPSSLRSA